jgi:chromosome partitioning protein
VAENSNPGRKTRVVAVHCPKGGSAKSTTAHNLAATFAERGKRSLIIDLDPSGGVTKLLGAPTSGSFPSALEFVTGQADPSECILTEADSELNLPPSIHLVPALPKLTELDLWLSKNLFRSPQQLLIDPIAKLRGFYDWIWIDTPPLLGAKTVIPALVASDAVLIPTVPEDLSVRGVGDAIGAINGAREVGFNIKVAGIVTCSVKNPLTRLTRALVQHIHAFTDEDGQTLALEPAISFTIVLQEAQALHQGIVQYQPSHAVSDQYRALATALEKRMERLERAVLKPQSRPQDAGEQPQPAMSVEEVANG